MLWVLKRTHCQMCLVDYEIYQVGNSYEMFWTADLYEMCLVDYSYEMYQVDNLYEMFPADDSYNFVFKKIFFLVPTGLDKQKFSA